MKKYYMCVLFVIAFVYLTGFEGVKENIGPLDQYKDVLNKNPFKILEMVQTEIPTARVYEYTPGEHEIVVEAQEIIKPDIADILGFEIPEISEMPGEQIPEKLKQLEFVYKGMAVLGSKKKAFIKDNVSGKSYSLEKGQTEDEIMVIDIFKDRVLVKIKGEDKEIVR